MGEKEEPLCSMMDGDSAISALAAAFSSPHVNCFFLKTPSSRLLGSAFARYSFLFVFWYLSRKEEEEMVINRSASFFHSSLLRVRTIAWHWSQNRFSLLEITTEEILFFSREWVAFTSCLYFFLLSRYMFYIFVMKNGCK